MKRGQVSTGLVIMGVVAIIAVIGLVLLFTRAGADAAAIGNAYGGGSVPKDARGYYPVSEGIAHTFPLPANAYYASVNAPNVEYPSPGLPLTQPSTIGTRTPAFIIAGGYNSIEVLYACNQDLIVGAQIRNVEELFNCYAVPNKGVMEGAVGKFPRASSAYARPNEGRIGKIGGDVYCYANSVGAEQQKPNSEDLIRNNIYTSLVVEKKSVDSKGWDSRDINGKKVPVCWVSQERDFIFPQ